MGACGAKTCETPYFAIVQRGKGVFGRSDPEHKKPVFVETPLGVFANISEGIRTHE